MENANLPTEKAHEPEEEAHQPLVQNMQNKDKKQNITFAETEKPDSQSSSIYKDVLSQPPQSLTHLQKLQWLQKRRKQGLWVQCDDCNRWRYLPTVLDRYELPAKWYCKMNPDSSMADCSVPEAPIHIHEEEDLIHSEYSAGSLVLARLPGWPWWPAMVDDCPDTEQYYWLDGFSDIPTHYNVVFFDTLDVTRAWVASHLLKPYSERKTVIKSALKNKSYQKRLDVAIHQANDAEKLSLESRLIKYSFIARYKGTVASPKKITDRDVKKYQKQFKRKFNIDLPNDFSDSDIETNDNRSRDGPKKRNVITLGTKKGKDTNNENLNLASPVKSSRLVQLDTNSAQIQETMTYDTSTTYVPNTSNEQSNTETIIEDSLNVLHREASRDSGDFDF